MHRHQQILAGLALLALGGLVASVTLATFRPGSYSQPYRNPDRLRNFDSRRAYLGVDSQQEGRLINGSDHFPAVETASLKPSSRCQGTLGHWCEEFLHQPVTRVKPPKAYGKACGDPLCNNAGVCDAETGICTCTAGWKGENCEMVEKRPCTWGWRQSGNIPLGAAPNSSVMGWTGSRCAGHCDEDVATCYCNGTQSHRPMIEKQCYPNKDNLGNPSEGWVEPEQLFGERGWCSAEQPEYLCDCVVEHLGGPLCDVPKEMMCLNACSGHGDCLSGFCMCHPGYYGHDCSRRVSKSSPGLQQSKPWLRSLLVDPPAANATREFAARPLIFVYDLPTDYNARLLQYRVHGSNCVHRVFDVKNMTQFTRFTYGIEIAFHEMLLQSQHRTLNPEEADFFYVPVYSACLVQPIIGFADHPWYYGPDGPRVRHGAAMLLEAKRWIQEHHPYWNRSKGEDHIWMITQDEGSCWAPAEIRSSIILSHWGRKDASDDADDLPPPSATAYTYDSYSAEYVHPEYAPQGWTHIIKGHPCYDPQKDLIIPSFRAPDSLLESPLLGFPAKQRNILLFFRGKIWDEMPFYSRGIRQRIYSLSKQHQWLERHKIVIGEMQDVPGDYSWLMASSKFCLVSPGAGWSSRAEEAVLHGCIPVVVQDNVDPVFATALRWQDFAIRVAEADVDLLPEILSNISPSKVLLMQEALSKVWHRLAYSSMPAFQQAISPFLEHNRNIKLPPESLPAPQYGDLVVDDAFATIMQWLYGRISLRQAAAQSI